MHLAAALVCAAVGAAGGTQVPRMLRGLPEPPEPAPEVDGSDGGHDHSPKVPYADLAATRGLTWGAAVVAGLAAGALGLVLGWTWWLAIGSYLAVVGVALSWVDLRTWLLPVRLVGPSYAVVGALVVISPLTDGTRADVLRALIGWAGSGVVLWLLWWFGGGLGYGDVRLGALLGLALGGLGWGPLVLGLWAGFALGALGWGPLRLLGVTADRRLPFGPFLLAGAWVGALVGQSLWAGLVG